MDVTNLHYLYSKDQSSIFQIIKNIYDRIECEDLHPTWISIIPREKSMKKIEKLLQIEKNDRRKYPLYGIPFAVKDNIDVMGLSTTCACSTFAKDLPNENAFVVEKLEAAGAICIGKTNMDQFATGLVGTRSPYGRCSTVFNPNYISGGSSSGSAVAVAKDLVTFSLGTDTAGSGRVPAMFNNIIGIKPTRGLLSTRGVVPACRTLDCVSIFSQTIADGALVFSVICSYDSLDPYSRDGSLIKRSSPWIQTSSIRFGIPLKETRKFFDDEQNPKLFEQILQTIKEQLHGELIEFDLQPFIQVADLLYKGPWVAERYASIGQFIDENEKDIDPIVRSIVQKANNYKAIDVFNSIYQLESLKKQTNSILDEFDVMIVPTTPRAYTLDQIASSPIELNSHLGYYTNFVNLLDLSAISIPCGFRDDGLPFGITIIGQAFTDYALLLLADRIHRLFSNQIGGTPRRLDQTPKYSSSISEPSNCFLFAVLGAHLSGQPLNYQLLERKGRLVRTCRTTNQYRLYALNYTKPAKPGLLFVKDGDGSGIELEIWAIPHEHVASFIELISPPLSIGNIFLKDGTMVKGFLVEPYGTENAEDITHYGGWKSYLNQSSNSSN